MDYLILIGIGILVGIIQSQDWWDAILYKLKLDMKPFNCALCSSFWISFIYLMMNGFYVEAIPYSAIVGLIAEMTYRKLMMMI